MQAMYIQNEMKETDCSIRMFQIYNNISSIHQCICSIHEYQYYRFEQ